MKKLFFLIISALSFNSFAIRPEGFPSERVLHLSMTDITPNSEIEFVDELYFPKGKNKIEYSFSKKYTLHYFISSGEIAERHVNYCSVQIEKVTSDLFILPKKSKMTILDSQSWSNRTVSLIGVIKAKNYLPISISCSPYKYQFELDENGGLEKNHEAIMIDPQIGHMFSAFYGDKAATRIKINLK
jgi:hypothetical protein